MDTKRPIETPDYKSLIVYEPIECPNAEFKNSAN